MLILFFLTVQVHTEGRKGWDDVSQAGEWLIAAYNAMLATPRWQRNNGSDFVFYDPHPGFTDGRAEREYLRIMCEDARLSVHIVVETGQRNICKVRSLMCGGDLFHSMFGEGSSCKRLTPFRFDRDT